MVKARPLRDDQYGPVGQPTIMDGTLACRGGDSVARRQDFDVQFSADGAATKSHQRKEAVSKAISSSVYSRSESKLPAHASLASFGA